MILFVSRPIESCQNWSHSITQQIDLVFNVFFLFYFFLRVRSSNECFWSLILFFVVLNFSSLPHKINFDSGVWIFIRGSIILRSHRHSQRLFLVEIGSVSWWRKFNVSSIIYLGMRFFRIARILNIPDILQFLHILRSSNSIRLTRIFCLLFTVWLSAAGFVHLVRRYLID